MKHRRFRLLKREDGQAIVEAAFVIPLLILIICGIIDFGWIFSNQLNINNCSREGARYAVVNSDSANLASLVTNKVLSTSGFEDPENVTVTVEIVAADEVKVTVTKKVKVLTPLTGIFVPDQEVSVTSTSVMRIG
ncbi:MAG: TadE/TadG family type IV pilus assembly protein [Christensenellales bacterium]